MASAPGDLEKAEARTDYPNSNQPTENSATSDVDVKKSKNAARLTKIFITSCVLGVFMDPLFLYIPLLNHDLKCLRLDNTIKIIALVSRLFTDLFYLLPEVTEVHEKEYLIPSITKEILESSIIVDILAILPLPQVAILIFFPKMRVSGSFGKRIMNFLVMVQYVPRVLRIYLSCKKARKPFKGYIPLWLKGLLNLFLYILASHVLGAFWYFFAAQQMISCWEHACRYGNGCGAITFNCHDHQTLKNITVLNNLCPIDPPNATLFDFGIYLNVLQSGALWSTDYPLKFLNSFCWGLRNLSSLASNLQPSFYTWEIAFVAFISIIGLILFVYLIGNLQTYVLIDTERLESHRRENKLKRKVKENDRKVESWLSGHGIPLSRKQKIMEEIKRELEENSDFDVVREILSILPLEEIKSCSPLSRLRKVPLLKDMDEGVLVEISEKLHPEKYTPGKIIINKDETLQMMLFIVDGHVIIEKTDGSQLEHLGPGDFYGEELLVSPFWTSSSDAKPTINQSVQAIDDVQALVLSATDMATLSFSSRRYINELRMVVTILQKVPKLQTMDKQVLKAMSHHLSPVIYKRDDYILRENQPVSRMFFVTRGEVTKNEKPPEANFIGEELLEWVLDKSFPNILPLSTCTVRVVSNDAEVLILKARMLKSVVSKFMKHFSNFPSPSDIRLTWLKKVEIFQQMDEQVLEAISKCLKHMNFNVAKRHILQEKKPLKMMFFVIRGVVLIESDSAMDVNVKNTCEIGSFYGEELVHWVTTWVHKSFPAKLPLSPGSALCSVRGGPVEILALKADDLKNVVSEFRSKFSPETTLPTDSDQPRELTILKNVEILKTMNEEVLKEVCKHLIEKTYKDEYIIMKDKQMEMMFFIVSGVVSVTNESSKHYLREGECPNHSGDELIQRWVKSKSTSVSAELPTSPSSFWAIGEVEVLILKAEDLARVQLGDQIVVENLRFKGDLLHPCKFQTTEATVEKMEEKAEATVADNWKEKAARRWNFLGVPLSISYDPNLNAASSLASNLQPSFNTWEILFVAFISIIGLLLFVYLIGNLQLDTERLESHRRKMKIEMKMKVKGREVESWLSKNGIPLHNMRVIMEKVRQELEENWDIDVVQEILSVLTPKYIKSCTPFRRLQKVPLLKDMDEGVLREISEKLKPKKYTPDQIIIKKDQTLEMMFFIVDGRVTIEKANSQLQLGAGDLYGEELLVSPLWTSSGDAKPINESVRAIDDVQALVLSATDMATLGFSSRRSINELRMVVTILQKVPKLQTMDKQVLKAMSHHLSLVSYKHDDYIVRENQPVSMMFFVMRGEVTKNENPLEENFIGEELLEWVLDKSFPTILPLSTCTVRVVSNDAEVLILKARFLKSVVSKFMKHFSDFASPSDIRLTWLKKVEIFQNMEEQVLEAILQCLKPMNFNVAKRHILQEKKPLKMMFFVIRGVVLIESDSAMDVNIKKTCEIGSFYGEELVHWVTTWVSHKSLPPKLPLSPCSALCGVLGGPVEILALKADDLKSVVSEFRSKFSTETAFPTESDQPREPLTILKNVESFETMDEEVLKEICKHLTGKTYKDEYIILKDKQMEMMFFIVSGVVSVTNESSKHYRREGERPNHSGDELIQHWMQSKSTKANVPAELPPSPFSFWAIGEVEVLVLKAEDLARVQLGDRIG
ncbi:unnamed protein product [Prunus armeniaca]